MATEKQIAANRANAQLSTGPRTDAGKAASSSNAVSHGLTSRGFIILPGQREAFDQLRNVTSVEQRADEENHWRVMIRRRRRSLDRRSWRREVHAIARDAEVRDDLLCGEFRKRDDRSGAPGGWTSRA